MRSSPISLLSCVLAYGCGSAQVDLSSDDEIGAIGDDTGIIGTPDDDSDDDDSDDDDSEDDDSDDDEEEEEPTYDGSYGGSFWFQVYSGYWDIELEDCDTEIEVTGEGELSGEAICLYDSGWGDPYEQTFDIAGEVRSDGEVSGVIVFELEWGDAVDLDLSGSISDDLEMTLASEGEYASDWSTLTVYGEGELRTSD